MHVTRKGNKTGEMVNMTHGTAQSDTAGKLRKITVKQANAHDFIHCTPRQTLQ